MDPSNLIDQIRRACEKSPKAIAILSPGREPIAYRQLMAQIDSAAQYLARTGMGRGDRVAVALPTGPAMATACLSTIAACACAPLDPTSPVDEISNSLAAMRIKAAILPLDVDSNARAAVIRNGLALIELDAHPRISGLFELVSSLPLGDTLPSPPRQADLAFLLQTSGTSSRPKLVPLTHRNIAFSVRDISAALELSPSDRALCMLPLFHVQGLLGSLAATLASGASIVCAPGFQEEEALDWMCDFGATWYAGVPAMHQAIERQATRRPEKAAKAALRFIRSGASPMPPALARSLEATFRAPVVEAYGMTEVVNIACDRQPPLTHKPGSVGLPYGSTRIAILDEAGSALPPRAIGEIAVRGENVTLGYEGGSAADAAAFSEGWMRTGDLGFLDEEGYLHIRGRLKEIINRGGEKISPAEVEEALLRHPAVEEAVVFAIPSAAMGEDVAAAVTLRKGSTLTARELRAFASSSLPVSKVPRRIVFLSEIPKGHNGKVRRIGMAERLRDQLSARDTGAIEGAVSETEDPIEAEVLRISREVLADESVSAIDDFWELGGDSLRAALLLARLNDRFGSTIQIPDLFKNGTIRGMARMIAEGGFQTRSEHVICLRPSGTKAPLLIVAPLIDDGVFYLRKFSEYFPPDRPVHCLWVKYGEILGKPFTSLIASRLTEELIEAIPAGPYCLLGYSSGGLVAIEIARLLLERGVELGFLGLLDTQSPGGVPARKRFKVLSKLRRLRDRGILGTIRYLASRLPSRFDSWMRITIPRLLMRGGPAPRLREAAFRRVVSDWAPSNVVRLLREGEELWPYPGTLVWFRVKRDGPEEGKGLVSGERGFVARELIVVEIPGNHTSIVRGPEAPSVARIVGEYLPD
jgi:acyl-CoA synthetase (AMP-forming)/AMP-acid ligase II/thioesterase domain-containing protein/acyl carrier protein